MLKTASIILLSLAWFSSAHAQSSLLEQVIQQPTHGPIYAFDIDYRDNDIQASAAVDPTRPLGQRLSVYSPHPSKWNSELREAIDTVDQNPLEDFWCSDFLNRVGRDVRAVQETDQHVVFAFSPQPGPDDDAEDRRFLAEMIAHLTIDKRTGRIQTFQVRNRRPFKPMMIAKVESYTLDAHCQVSPDGRPYVANLETHLIGKVALRRVHETEVRHISNLRPAG